MPLELLSLATGTHYTLPVATAQEKKVTNRTDCTSFRMQEH